MYFAFSIKIGDDNDTSRHVTALCKLLIAAENCAQIYMHLISG